MTKTNTHINNCDNVNIPKPTINVFYLKEFHDTLSNKQWQTLSEINVK